MSQQPHERLARFMDEQRIKLKLRWVTVAIRAEIDESNIRRIRRGDIPITDMAAARLEDALEWERGSVAAILAGGFPTELPRRGEDDLRDDTEREIWGIREIDETMRWMYIDRRRARLEREQGSRPTEGSA